MSLSCRSRFLLPLVLTLAGMLQVQAAPRLPAIFSDGAVLQADKPIRVWGWAEPGEAVTISFGESRASTTTAATGRWNVVLPAEGSSQTPRDLVVNTLAASIFRRDILVGEVWLCSGQSNMAWPLSRTDGGEAFAAAADYPLIRLFKIGRTLADREQEDVAAHWQVCTPESAAEITAVGFHFARELQPSLGVPVGIIHSAHGATAIEAWIGMDALTADPGAATVFQRTPTSEPRTPAWAWNAMAAPLAGYAVRGLLWYQGETNAHWGPPAEYTQTFPLLIRSWRAAWADPEMHVLFVQLPNFIHNSSPNGLTWPKLREQQLTGLTLPHTAMAVAIDVGDPNDIHPTSKHEVGHRLYLKALNQVYGQPTHCDGPMVSSHSFNGSQAVVRFTRGEGKALVLREGASGFELAGTDQTFHPAAAVLDGDSVRLTAPAVPAPVAIRYAWRNDPAVSLFDDAGLPAAPFRTDSWDDTGPRWVQQPQPASVQLGQTVALSALAIGANLSYQWSREGQDIAGATGPVLTIAEALASHAGRYRVQVSDGSHSVHSVAASLTVIQADEQVLMDPADGTLGGWGVTVERGTPVLTTAGNLPVVALVPESSSAIPILTFTPPNATIDLSAHRELRLTVTNTGTATVNFTAWGLSGPGWGGSPATEQVSAESGRIGLGAGQSREVVIDLHQRYPGPNQKARCMDATRLTGIRLVVQSSSGGRLAIGAVRVAGVPAASPSDPVRRTVEPVEVGEPAPGRRVLRQLPGKQGTALGHVMRLPHGWDPAGSYPILVNYPGNFFYHKFCHSSGLTRDGNFGPSVVAGEAVILLQLPYVRFGGTEEEDNGWGDPQLTVDYALAAVREVVDRFGGDSNLILYSGFSRGAYGAAYIGLRTEAIADLWHGFILSQGHPKSTEGWNGSSEGYAERIARLDSRPVFLTRASWEGAINTTNADPGLGSSAHADVGFLEPSAAANALTAWLAQVRTNRPGTSPLTGRIVDQAGQGIAGVTVFSGIHRVEANAEGSFVLPGLSGAVRTVTLTGPAAHPAGGFSIPLGGQGYAAGNLVAPFSLTALPQDLAVNAFAPAAFSVAVHASGPVSFLWHHEGLPLPDQTGSTLLLPAAAPELAGCYTVTVTDAAGASASASASLAVIQSGPPVIVQQPVSVTISQAEVVTFRVGVSGSVPLAYQWSLNGRPIAGANDPTLTVQAGLATTGAYSVAVSNPLGSARSAAATLQFVGRALTTTLASADCFVQRRYLTENQNSTVLQVAARGGANNRKIYLRFPLAKLASAGQTIEDSELRLNLHSSPLLGTATGFVTLSLYAITDGQDSWEETGIAWANAPKSDPDSAGGFLPAGTVLLATVRVDSTNATAHDPVVFSSSELSDFLNWAIGRRGDAYETGLNGKADGQITLMIGSDSPRTDPGLSFRSREAGLQDHAPRLNTYMKEDPVPTRRRQ